MGAMIEQMPNKTENGTVDIWDDWNPILTKMREFSKMFKIKLKSKGYEQEYVRTMFFMKPETRDFKIDGVTYELSNEAKMTCWRTKCHIVEMFEKFVIINQGSPIFDESSYLGIKKELVAAVKTFEKMYNVHKKKTYPEINGII